MLLLFCRVVYFCFPLCGEGKCEEAVEDVSVLWQNEAGRELRYKTLASPLEPL